ncbi:MAG: SHOCT domain-containing protein [Firmicutes bacterium]|nr:SHOCT domain-containing protein [Alicyclobacillaceae bacterium]MCL6497385.1 SHOCT domain-containing protein [Bacillota bacterium]
MWGYPVGPWGWIGPLLMVLFWVVIVAGAVAAIRIWWGTDRYRAGEEGLKVLERRYAAGEISREEFLAMRRDLIGR